MKSQVLTLGLIMASLSAIAQEHTSHYNKSVFSGYHRLQPTQRDRSVTAEQKAKQQFPGMMVTVDKLSGNISDIFGIAIPVSGNTLQDKIQGLFQGQLKSLGFDASEWVLTAEVNAPHASFVNYAQTINGRKVVFADLKFRFTKDGLLQRIKTKNYGKPGNLTPTLSVAAAKLSAEQDLSGVTVAESNVESDWHWFPVPTMTGYELRPAYAFNIKGQGEDIPVDLDGYVDGITGKVLYRTNKVKETINKTVKGEVYKQNPTLASSVEPLPNLKVTINGTDYWTDTAGVLNVTSLNAPITTTVKLEGLWARVRAAASGNITPSFQYTINTNGTTYVFDTTSPSSIRHVNAYYHVNRVHDFMKQFFPTFTAMDNPLTTNVDVNGSCNAFYNGSSINFYAAGNGCNSFALCGDIVYHEYGHGISDKFYGFMGQGSMSNSALNEGNSDIWGIGITGDPVLGKGSSGTSGIIRRYDLAPKVYPTDIVGEEHADGEIIAGAWWDVAQNINSVDTMSQLFAATYWDTPDGPDGMEGPVYHDVLISALQNDDDDNNLNNGTPHFTQIVTAFARHGIYLLGDASLSHTEIAHQPAQTPIQISADLTIATPAFFQKLDLHYKTRGGQWDTVTMVNTGGNTYTAQIPAQPLGTIVDYYFAVYDNQSTMNATFPSGYNPTGPSSMVTIPYQFGVGLAAKTTIDFESPLNANWIVANAPNDNATAGHWIQAKPIGSYVNGFAQSIPIQPNMDHTTGTTGKCLVTANATSTSAQPGAADVDNGATSVITPLFDVSGFSKPVVEYWRWYTNSGGSNPSSDYWSVFIKAQSAGIWFIRVDYTKATDASWRRRIFHVSDYLSTTNSFMLKFQAEDANPGSIVEAAVDDLVIYDEDDPTSADDIEVSKAKIYPNPAGNEIRVSLAAPAQDGYILLSDVTGKQVVKVSLTGNKDYILPTSEVPAGLYYVTVKTDKLIHAQKITIVH